MFTDTDQHLAVLGQQRALDNMDILFLIFIHLRRHFPYTIASELIHFRV